MKTYAETFFFLLVSDSHPSLNVPSSVTAHFVFSCYHPPTSSPSYSPQEGEADGGSGKIQWGEDEGRDGSVGDQVRKGGHKCWGSQIDGEGTMEEKKRARQWLSGETMIKWWGEDGGR